MKMNMPISTQLSFRTYRMARDAAQWLTGCFFLLISASVFALDVKWTGNASTTGYDNSWIQKWNWRLLLDDSTAPDQYPNDENDTVTFNGGGDGDTAPLWDNENPDTHLYLQWLYFKTADCASYTISAKSGSSNHMPISTGGGVSVDSDVTTDQTINMTLRPQNGTTTYTNNGTGMLTFDSGMQSYWDPNPLNATVQFDGSGNIQAGALLDRDGNRTMSVVKEGSGTLTLSGANALSGLVSVNEGTLAITGTGAGTTTFGDKLHVGYDAGDSAALTISGGTTTVTSDLRLGENTSISGDGTTSGTITQTGGTLNVDRLVAGRWADGTGTYTISDGTLTTNGNSWAAFAGTGTFTQTGGDVAIGGTYTLANDSSANGKLNLNGGTFTTSGLVKGNGTAVVTMAGGTLRAGTTFATPVDITLNASGGGTFDSNGNTLTLNGSLGGDGTLTKTGAGTVTLSADNSYTGSTTVSEGILQIGNGGGTGTLGNNSDTSVASGATLVIDRDSGISLGYTYSGALSGSGTVDIVDGSRLNFETNNQSASGDLRFNVDGILGIKTKNSGVSEVRIGELTGSGRVQRADTAGGAATLFIGGKNTDSTFSGAIVSNEISVEKVGSGTLTLSGDNTYAGGTTVTGGTLLVNGSILGPITVDSGGTLGGDGTIGGAGYTTSIADGGTLAPGNSPGITNENGSHLTIDGTLAMELGAWSADNNPLTFDQVINANVLTLGATSILDVFDEGWTKHAWYPIVQYTDLAGAFGTVNAGAKYALDYGYAVDGLVGTWIAIYIPEPTSLALLSLGLLLAIRRRRG